MIICYILAIIGDHISLQNFLFFNALYFFFFFFFFGGEIYVVITDNDYYNVM